MKLPKRSLLSVLSGQIPITQAQTGASGGAASQGANKDLEYCDEPLYIITTGTGGGLGYLLTSVGEGKGQIEYAIWLSIMMWTLTIVVFLTVLAPVAGLIALFPSDVGFWGVVVAFIFAWSAKAALIEPIAIYALMQVHSKRIEGQEPNPECEAKLEEASKHFRELKERAMSAVGVGG